MPLPRWLRAWFGPVEPRPRPAGWNKTCADLAAENRSLTHEEMEWAREYTREQLRAWARFPRDGEEFEAIAPTEVGYITGSDGPWSGGGRGVLPAGTRIRVWVPAGEAEPIAVHAQACEAEAIERLLVPEDERTSRHYRGYGLFLDTEVLNRHFRRAQGHDPGTGRPLPRP